MLIPGAEPFFFPGGETGVVLVHGFTGTPFEMRWMGEYLARQGHTVLGVRLAGHATQPDDLLRIHWQDWLASVEEGVLLLKPHTRQVFLMGLSLGGVLSLLGGARLPVQGVVAMSTLYRLPNHPLLPFARLLHPFMPRQGFSQAENQTAASQSDHPHYPYFPTRVVCELTDCVQAMRQALPEIKIPVQLIHSHQDGTVAPENMDMIYAALKTPHKEKLWLEKSGHVITCEPERETVFAAAQAFLQRVGMPA